MKCDFWGHYAHIQWDGVSAIQLLKDPTQKNLPVKFERIWKIFQNLFNWQAYIVMNEQMDQKMDPIYI